MSRLTAADPPARGLFGARCPNCHELLSDKLICWPCCERLCDVCGQATGSAFLELCWPCSFRAVEEDTTANDPTPLAPQAIR